VKRLLTILLLAGTPAFAANDGEVTILRGTPAPPQPWYQPPPPPVVVEQQTVIYPPSYSMSYWPPLIVNQVPPRHRGAPAVAPPVPNGWPLLGRSR